MDESLKLVATDFKYLKERLGIDDENAAATLAVAIQSHTATINAIAERSTATSVGPTG